MQVILDPSDKQAQSETPDTLFEPIKAVGVLIDLILTIGKDFFLYLSQNNLVALIIVPLVSILLLFVQIHGPAEGYRRFIQTVQSVYIQILQ